MDSVTQARLLILLLFLVYFLPSWMLIGRHKRNATAIVWLNILAGWTGIGWLVAFIWALTKDAHESKS